MWKIDKTLPIWNDDYKTFPYNRQNIKDSEINDWRKQGYYHEHFTGSMYDSRSPMPSWLDEVALQLGLTNVGAVFYKMVTLDIMPPHVDHFETYMRVFGVERANIHRALIFLEDWQPGHYFEIDGVAHTNWSKGEYAMWSADVPHSAANIGIKPRYTLQLTGTKIDA